jgi:hypothetical protein
LAFDGRGRRRLGGCGLLRDRDFGRGRLRCFTSGGFSLPSLGFPAAGRLIGGLAVFGLAHRFDRPLTGGELALR